ncbi:uncharacterized protein LOC114520560 [Dendronephthya gigantea]|uniref:uncharacterized protein LOC114520560 n=1 Tax=Dendronephthya gigantea TaxID=151771 RepID=UPI00106DBA62|nr:uncharacterized protein LOC114520560 [Dendronephthya gigantea]
MQKLKGYVLRLMAFLLPLVLLSTAGNVRNEERPGNDTRGDSAASEFRTHMLRAISTFSISRQCNILAAILKDSGENPPRVMKAFMETVPYQYLPCIGMKSPSESPSVNTSGLRLATDKNVARLFNNFPFVFQCKILTDVTIASRGNVAKQEMLSALTQTMSELSTNLNVDDSLKKCVDAIFRGLVTNTRVQLGVRLRNSMPLEAWLERFRQILPKIYLTYISTSGKISDFVSGWTKDEDGTKIPIIPNDQFLVKIKQEAHEPVIHAGVAMVTFSLYTREISGDYRLINGDEIVAAFEGISRSVLNSYIQGDVVGWRAHGERDSVGFERMRRVFKPNSLESFRLQESLPKYLLKFFKSMTADGRCYVLQHISSYVERDLSVVEKRYHTLGLLPRKYFCSRAMNISPKPKRKHRKPLAQMWKRLDKFIRAIPTPLPTFSTTILHAHNSTVIRETRPFNSMEIVMFALLGFLCLLIMVFVANCVVFTFKTKQLNSQYGKSFQAPQVVFGNTDGEQYLEHKSAELPHEKLSLTDNPQARVSEGSAGDRRWRLMSATSEGGVTVCDVISDDDEPERVSTV